MPDTQRMEIQSWDEGSGTFSARLIFFTELDRVKAEMIVLAALIDIQNSQPDTEITTNLERR